MNTKKLQQRSCIDNILSDRDEKTTYKVCNFCGCDIFKVYPKENLTICFCCGVSKKNDF
ncbi:MAG: hypothetical protein R2685_08015 [Candidatus Nitrosocosmicus sp.]|nr:hypothetical protein [Candidatus Nitrosocosmicus sp.]